MPQATLSECLPAAQVLDRGAALPSGYWCWTRRRTVYAHRHIWEECFGEIPKGAEIHHICEQRDCVNPEHLALKGSRFAHMQEHRRVVCTRGLHLMTGDNVFRDPYPRCRACRNATRRHQLADGPP